MTPPPRDTGAGHLWPGIRHAEANEGGGGDPLGLIEREAGPQRGEGDGGRNASRQLAVQPDRGGRRCRPPPRLPPAGGDRPPAPQTAPIPLTMAKWRRVATARLTGQRTPAGDAPWAARPTARCAVRPWARARGGVRPQRS